MSVLIFDHSRASACRERGGVTNQRENPDYYLFGGWWRVGSARAIIMINESHSRKNYESSVLPASQMSVVGREDSIPALELSTVSVSQPTERFLLYMAQHSQPLCCLHVSSCTSTDGISPYSIFCPSPPVHIPPLFSHLQTNVTGSGSKTTAEYLPQPLDGNESSTCGSSASPSRCNSAAGMQHQQWQEDGQGSRLLSPSDTAYQVSSHAVGRSNNNIDNPQDEGLCSDDAMLESDGGSSSREDYFDTASSSYETEDTGSMYSDEDGSSITTRSRQQDFGGYRDTMNHHSNSAGHSIPTATPSQHPSLGRHHTSHPFFNAHLSRHHLDANHAARNGEDSHRRTSTAGDSFVPGRLATGTAFAAAVVAVVAPLGQVKKKMLIPGACPPHLMLGAALGSIVFVNIS